MRITINDKEVVIPTSLSEFTLGQRIAFQEEYGNELDTWLKKIVDMEDGLDKEMEEMEFRMEKMFRTFAFFAGCTPDALKESEFVDNIANIYHSCLSVLFESESKVECLQEYHWKGETWVLHPPSLKHGDQMKFGEFIDSKQVVQNLMELGKSRWDAMLNLCAIYLRRPSEEYDESFLYDNSERIEMMRELPMDIALGVGFFLTASISLSNHHFQSSNVAE
ncbi:hypothetical protein [Chitinophaga sancti]|uniref:Uncharacterized protein n=1 Tax=Chitinophaga sancti TaxID=1004 RepID=A0A1K1LZD1_9BACT|nr:hypothetical protein [Chitinophaga sancti]WQD64737.1 hypothetical protein U0033_10050 [Chitinophaga sancti]WQG89641.1 hypothetical protein SR876_32425 [Chitinophaga sancti]SFW16227.1 hypothetical protein SAMN05661012_00333 [Chitinophaga sancti]